VATGYAAGEITPSEIHLRIGMSTAQPQVAAAAGLPQRKINLVALKILLVLSCTVNNDPRAMHLL
jgi:hypothetical protein